MLRLPYVADRVRDISKSSDVVLAQRSCLFNRSTSFLCNKVRHVHAVISPMLHSVRLDPWLVSAMVADWIHMARMQKVFHPNKIQISLLKAWVFMVSKKVSWRSAQHRHFVLIIDDLDQIMLSMDGETPQPLLTLVETETVFILSIDSSIVANDAKDLETIKLKNERYVEGRTMPLISRKPSLLFSCVKANKAVISSAIGAWTHSIVRLKTRKSNAND